MKIIKKSNIYTNKVGEVKTAWQFYLELENGNLLRIEPYVYKDKEGKVQTSTFKMLALLAEERK